MYSSITSYDDDFTSTYIITVQLAVKQVGKNGYSPLESKIKTHKINHLYLSSQLSKLVLSTTIRKEDSASVLLPLQHFCSLRDDNRTINLPVSTCLFLKNSVFLSFFGLPPCRLARTCLISICNTDVCTIEYHSTTEYHFLFLVLNLMVTCNILYFSKYIFVLVLIDTKRPKNEYFNKYLKIVIINRK